MKTKWQKLAGQMLIEASEELSKHGCNDWKWPADWSLTERKEFALLMVADNVGRLPSEFEDEDREDVEDMVRGEFGPPDWWVCLVLGKILDGSVINEQ